MPVKTILPVNHFTGKKIYNPSFYPHVVKRAANFGCNDQWEILAVCFPSSRSRPFPPSKPNLRRGKKIEFPRGKDDMFAFMIRRLFHYEGPWRLFWYRSCSGIRLVSWSLMKLSCCYVLFWYNFGTTHLFWVLLETGGPAFSKKSLNWD